MTRRVVIGGRVQVEEAIARSTVSKKVNTSYIERENGKLRADTSRLTRKTLGFPKDRQTLRRSIAFSMVYDHYCRPNKGLRKRGVGRPRKRGGPYVQWPPIVAPWKTDHIWRARELI